MNIAINALFLMNGKNTLTCINIINKMFILNQSIKLRKNIKIIGLIWEIQILKV